MGDFSCEHLNDDCVACNVVFGDHSDYLTSLDILKYTIESLNYWRRRYLATKDKDDWWQMIQLLPSSYNQKRTVMMNYEVLANIYKSRKDHKLDEWGETRLVCDNPEAGIDGWWPNKFYSGFCDWIKTLPYSELITGYTDEIDLSVPKEVIDDLEHNDLQAEVYRILKEEINNRFGCKEDEK